MQPEMIDHLDEVNAVAAEYIKGNDETAISKTLDIPRSRVTRLLNEWRSMTANNEAVRARSREALAAADQHYNGLIKKAYEVIDEASQNSNLTAKTNAIKLVLDIESKRIDMLQKAGLLENKELADELLEMERKQEVLASIIREVSGKCDKCKYEVVRRLNALSSEAVTIVHE
jgi:hypothetical protein